MTRCTTEQAAGDHLHGVDLQCRARVENETLERRNVASPPGIEHAALHCECGDPQCTATVTPTHAEYEAVRAYGSHFIVGVNHEDPETDWVLRETPLFAVVDVVAHDPRYVALACNPRHSWVAPSAPKEDPGR